MSAINNIVGWQELLDSGKVVKQADGEFYMVMGSFNTNNKTKSTAARTDSYLVKVSDFLADAGVKEFLALLDTPASYAGASGKVAAVNITEDGLEFIDAPSNTVSSPLGSPISVTPLINPDGSINYSLNAIIEGGANTWDLPTVAFISKVEGDNNTGEIGDGNKPYFSLSSAAAAGARKFILMPGVWTGDLYIQYNDVEIYAMQGVEFKRGIRLLSSAIVNFRLSGHAIFTGFQYWAFRIQSMAPAQVAGETYGQIDIEFDYANNSGGLFALEQDSASPRVNYSCDWAKTSGLNGAGYNVRLVGGAEIRMDIKQFFHSQHTLFHCRNQTSGKLIVNCPDMRIIEDYTASYGNLYRSVLWCDSISGAYVEINGNLTSEHPVALDTTQGSLVHSDNSYYNPGKIVINGDLHAENNFCVAGNYRSVNGEFIINGNLTSGRLCIYDNLTGWGGASNQTHTYNGSIIDGEWHNLISRGRTFYFKDCSFLVREDGSGINPTAANIFIASGGGASDTDLYFYNCVMESGKSSDPLIETFKNFPATYSVATINTVSNTQIGTAVVDDWANFIVNPLLVTPKIR